MVERRGPPALPRGPMPREPPGIRAKPPNLPKLTDVQLTSLQRQLSGHLENKLALYDHTARVKPVDGVVEFNVPHDPKIDRREFERARAAEELIRGATKRSKLPATIVRENGRITVKFH